MGKSVIFSHETQANWHYSSIQSDIEAAENRFRKIDHAFNMCTLSVIHRLNKNTVTSINKLLMYWALSSSNVDTTSCLGPGEPHWGCLMVQCSLYVYLCHYFMPLVHSSLGGGWNIFSVSLSLKLAWASLKSHVRADGSRMVCRRSSLLVGLYSYGCVLCPLLDEDGRALKDHGRACIKPQHNWPVVSKSTWSTAAATVAMAVLTTFSDFGCQDGHTCVRPHKMKWAEIQSSWSRSMCFFIIF